MYRALLLLAISAAFLSVAPRGAGAEPSTAEIKAWLSALEAPRFVIRERAMSRLIDAGAPAIAPILDKLGQGDREFRTRAVHILHRLALSGDDRAESRAYKALSQLAASGPANVISIAGKSLTQIHDLREQRAIKWLRERGAKIEDGYQQFGFFPSQQLLSVEIGQQWKGVDKDLEQLRWLRSVQQVVLNGAQVKDSWFEHILKMDQLASLSVKRGEISDETIARIVRTSKHLKILKLKYVEISDASVEHLAKLTTAVQLHLYGTLITPDAAARLKVALKDVQVDYRAGGFLGVGCQPHPLGCLIALVHPGSAADQAQFSAGDIIVRYGGKPVIDFDELTRLISADRVAEKVELIVVRRIQTLGGRWRSREGDELGVVVEPHAAGVQVNEVAVDSVGARLGLQKGDVIFQINDRRINDADELSKAFAGIAVGVEASLQFARGGQLIKRVVALGEWD